MPTYDELSEMSPTDLNTSIDNLIADNKHEICEDSTFCDCSAGTNADGWMVDDYETADEPELDDDAREISVPINYHTSGDQLEDKGHCGTEISGTAIAIIDENGRVTFDEVTAEVAVLD